MTQSYILAIDQGTTGSTAVLIGEDCKIHYQVSIDFRQHFPRPGWVEHDLEDIWNSVVTAVEQVVKNAQSRSQIRVAAIGLTNQRETTALWRKDESASPLARAIVWQDRRTSELCDRLKKQKLEKWIHRQTGLCLDPYFSATKLSWLLKHTAGVQSKVKKNQICFGTIDSFLLFRLTGHHKTDPTNASRTLLMNLYTQRWDSDLLKLFSIPSAILPEIVSNASLFGTTTKTFGGLPKGIPVYNLMGDQQAALFGQGCFKPGSLKCTYGTGAFALVNIGERPIVSKNKLLCSVAWRLLEQNYFCLEGSTFVAGSAVQWLRDGLQFIKDASEIETLALEVESSEGVTFVPSLTGLGAPYWNAQATGLLSGITRGTQKAHIARAVLEGIGLQIFDLLTSMERDLKRKIVQVKVDGGPSDNQLLMQFQADILRRKVLKTAVTEATVFGTGAVAGIGAGFWDMAKLSKISLVQKEYQPKMAMKEHSLRLKHWRAAVRAVQEISKNI